MRGYIVEKERDSGTNFASFLPVALRVMTYNIKGQAARFHRDHIERIGRVIAGAGADIVGLQEVHRGTWQSRRRDQVAELEAASGMKAYFGPSFGDEQKAYGNAILTNARVEETHVEALPGKGEPRSIFASCFREPVITHRATKSCLDSIFVDPRWQIRDGQVLREGPSDHRPLIAELEPAAVLSSRA